MQFLNSTEDVQWLKDEHLSGVTLPTEFASFQSFALKGNEDAPDSVDLYASADPLYTDAFYRVKFGHGAPIYCTGERMRADASADWREVSA